MRYSQESCTKHSFEVSSHTYIGNFEVVQYNGIIKIYPRPNLVGTITIILKF